MNVPGGRFIYGEVMGVWWEVGGGVTKVMGIMLGRCGGGIDIPSTRLLGRAENGMVKAADAHSTGQLIPEANSRRKGRLDW